MQIVYDTILERFTFLIADITSYPSSTELSVYICMLYLPIYIYTYTSALTVWIASVPAYRVWF